MSDDPRHDPHRIEGSDPDEDTAEIPAVGAPLPKAKIADLVWIGGGAIAGLVAMVVFAGGLGSGDEPAPPVTTANTPRTRTLTPAANPPRTTRTITRRADTTTAAAPTATPTDTGGTDTGTGVTTTTTTPTDTGSTITAPTDTTGGPPYRMTVDAVPEKTVYIEVRAGGPTGTRLWAGEVGKGLTRTFDATGPLWIGFGWAGNAVVTIDGRRVSSDGGTVSFIASAEGLSRTTGG